MQANKDHDWTDDADFWNEAWADMDARLDAEPDRRKGGMPWWQLFLGVAAALLLAVTIAGGNFFDQEPQENTPAAPTILAAGPVDAKANTEDELPVAISLAPAEASQEQDAQVTTMANSSAGNAAEQTDLPDNGPIAHTSRTPPSVDTRPSASKSNPNTENIEHQGLHNNRLVNERHVTISGAETQGQIPVKQTLTEPIFSPNEDGISSMPAQVKEPAKAPLSKPILGSVAVGRIALSPLESVGSTEQNLLDLPTVPLQRQRYTNPLTFDIGLSSSYELKNPGFLAGIGYRINKGKKLSFPLSIRYRLDQIALKDYPAEESLTVGGGNGTPAADANDLLFQPISIGYLAVEIGAGLALEVAPRLRFSTGLTAAYITRGVVNFEGQDNDLINLGANEELNSVTVDFDRGFAAFELNYQSDQSPSFRRLVLRANLGVAYDLSPRWGVNFNASQLLRQLDREDILGVQTGRMELGVSYRLR